LPLAIEIRQTPARPNPYVEGMKWRLRKPSEAAVVG
jgi:hypothetical protein